MPGASKAGAKRETVAELAEHFSNSSAAVLTEYRGLTVAQVTELRRSLGTGTTYAVVKNTLTKIAAEKAGVRGLDALLTGPTAVAFVQGDPVEAAKALRAFGKENPLLIVKGGVLDGNPLTAEEIGKLADLESREVLLSKLAGALNATTAKAAALFQAPLAQAARMAGALLAKAEADPSILAPVPGSRVPAADKIDQRPGSADEAYPEASTDDATTATELSEAVIAPEGVSEAAPEATEAVATATEGGVTLTVDEAVLVEIGEPAPASNADAPADADTEHGAGVETDETPA